MSLDTEAGMRSAAPPWRFRRPGILPGFGLSFGITMAYLALIVLIPLTVLMLRTAALSAGEIWAIASAPRTVAAIGLSFGLALAAAVVNAFFGLLVAWVLVRYRFPSRRLFDAMVDLPFALPTAVAGIALTALYAPTGWIGRVLAPLGIEVAFQPLGIVVAMVFVGMPFMVRTVQPVLAELEAQIEEAGASLGASRLQVIRRLILPTLLPAVLAGFTLSFSRAIGEYGSVIFIAGNLPFVSEIAPLLIVIRLEEFDYPGAMVVASIMLVLAFILLFVINLLQAWTRRRLGHV